MSFADIINQEQKKLEEQQGGNDKVEYPKTKHKRLFFGKDQRELYIQVLPAADLVSSFAVPVRKIFLQAKSSQGKNINSNFTLDPDFNNGSLLENKINEWAEMQIIPNGFGGQSSPRRYYLVNVVQVYNQNGQFVQERDQEGNLVVRVFEMPQSGYSNLIRKLADPMLNPSGSELSFMDINNPAPIKISRPAKGQMEYPVEVYTAVKMPPLGQGWETQLEDLNAQAVPTERLVNGDKWVQAFIDMKEGRKPNQNNGGQGQAPQAPQQPQTNPYANQQPAMGQGFQQNPSTTFPPQAPGQAQGTMVGQAQEPQIPQMPQGGQGYVEPQTYQQPQMTQQTAPAQEPVDPNNFPGMTAPDQGQAQAPQQPNIPAAPQAPQQPQVPQQPEQQAVPQQGQVQEQGPTHNVDLNSNGLGDIDAMLEKELGGL